MNPTLHIAVFMLLACTLVSSRIIKTSGKGTGLWSGRTYAKRSGDCVDNHPDITCSEHKEDCKSSSVYYLNMKKYCKETCGFCLQADAALDNLQSDSNFKAGGCLDADKAFALHNDLRAKHGASPLKWDNKLAKEAEEWAQENAAVGQMHHSTEEQRNMEGENLAFVWVGIPEFEQTAVQDGTKMWIEEEPLYNSQDPSAALHFTQMVWKKTKKIGIGCAKSGDMEYITARYLPRGNFESFTENVQM